MKNLLKLTSLSLVASSAIYASGYKIPETSTNAVALSAANIAHNKNADAAYYNPANMVFMSDKNHIEANLMYIGLDAPNYKGRVGAGQYDIDAKKETFIVPSLHYVSQKLGDSGARVGVSVVVPGGLSKRWDVQPAKSFAEEFTLQIVEVNPTAAFEVTDNLALAVGFRMVHTSGVVKSNTDTGTLRDMTGDSVDFGYNLALAYQPIDNLEIGLTYRSNVNLSVEGDAKLSGAGGALTYNGDASVDVPLPATFHAAIAYTLPTKTTLEFVYEKVYWSAYNKLDFNYGAGIHPALDAGFGAPIEKDWKDTQAFRIGITQELDSLTLMAGAVIDENPVPSKTLGFELPTSDSIAYSLGARYQVNDKIDIGLAALYSMHKNRTISAADSNDNAIAGEFTNSNVILVSAGIGYKF